MQHRESKISGFDNLQLYYQSWTPEQTRRGNVLVVHGHGDHSGRYLNVVNQLVPAGYTVQAYDLRGHGHSEGKRGFLMAWEEFRLDMDAVVNHVRKESAATPLFLYGHSLGGLIALDYLLHFPDAARGLVTSAPLVGTPGISPVVITVARILSRIAPRTMLHTGTDAAGISRDPAAVQAYIDDPLVHDWGSARFGGETLSRGKWVQEHAPELKLPVFVLQGGDDRIALSENSHRLFNSAGSEDKIYREYPEGYHEPHNDIDHEVVLSEVVDWLNGHI